MAGSSPGERKGRHEAGHGSPPEGRSGGAAAADGGDRRTMIPARGVRPRIESALMRLIATAGVVAVGVAISAIMTSKHSDGWLIGLVVAIVTVVLSAILWSSRRL